VSYLLAVIAGLALGWGAIYLSFWMFAKAVDRRPSWLPEEGE